MATTYISFSSTPRNHRSDVLNNHGKITTAKAAALTDAELGNAKNMIADAYAALGIALDAPTSCSLSLTSGSLVIFQLTV